MGFVCGQQSVLSASSTRAGKARKDLQIQVITLIGYCLCGCLLLLLH